MAEVFAPTQFLEFVKFLAACGENVRHTTDPDTGRPMSHLYEFLEFGLGMQYDTARKVRDSFLDANPQFRNKIPKLLFPCKIGAKQNHKSWAVDANTLYAIVTGLKPEYSQPFRDFAVKCSVGVLGGSVALQEATHEMEDVQATLPDQHLLRVFGRDAEYNDEKIGINHQSRGDHEQYIRSRYGAGKHFCVLKAAMQKFMPGAKKHLFIQIQVAITEAVSGNMPGLYLIQSGFGEMPNINARCIMTNEQLQVVNSLEQMATTLASSYIGTDGIDYQKEVFRRCVAAGTAFQGWHGNFVDPIQWQKVKDEKRELRRQRMLLEWEREHPQQITNNNFTIDTATINQYK